MRASPSLVDRIDALLPQTQCAQCGYPACRPYAEAIARGDAKINQCPPGGAAGIVKLAALLECEPLPLNPVNGIEQPLRIAFVEEAFCIGCTLCIQACPVDAIIGAPKLMHAVIADLCTGCGLCVPPCPVDCIRMDAASFVWDDERARAARARYVARNLRLRNQRAGITEARDANGDAARSSRETEAPLDDRQRKRKAIIAAAVARARALRR